MNIISNNLISKFKINNKIINFKEKLSNILTRSPFKDIFESTTLDIHSKGKFPSNVLSNFHESRFKFDGIQINSMEGFLQSLKTSDINLQKKICKLIGKDAKNAGIEIAQNYDMKTLHWKGQPIDRFSDDYKHLLKRVYKTKFEQDPLFRNAIKASKDKRLVHSIGKNSQQETILTEQEFTSLLVWLRQFL